MTVACIMYLCPLLICKNVSTEGPGTIEEYLNLEGIPCTIVELSIREPIPNDGFSRLCPSQSSQSMAELRTLPVSY